MEYKSENSTASTGQEQKNPSANGISIKNKFRVFFLLVKPESIYLFTLEGFPKSFCVFLFHESVTQTKASSSPGSDRLTLLNSLTHYE